MVERFIKEGSDIKPNPLYIVPQQVILHFFQSWGQSMQERLDALKVAAELAGFSEVQFELKESGFRATSPRDSLWGRFYDELCACFPKGQFELEEEAVRQVILKYQALNKN